MKQNPLNMMPNNEFEWLSWNFMSDYPETSSRLNWHNRKIPPGVEKRTSGGFLCVNENTRVRRNYIWRLKNW